MLQPMQPVGQQKPGMPQGAPQRAPGQQMLPAGAAMQQGILPGGIASNPEDIKAAYGGTPQGQQKLKQAAGQGDYLSAIALSQILEEEREKASEKASQMQQGRPPSIIDQKRQEAVDLRRQDLEEQQAKRLGVEQQRSQSAIAQMAQQAARPQMPGIAGLPVQNVAQPQAMAAGGIVAFAGDTDGSYVEDEATRQSRVEGRDIGADPYANMSNRQIVEAFARRQLGTDRNEAERRARENYMKVAGYTPEEKYAQQKRLEEAAAYDKKMYDPEELRQERLIAALAGGAGVGSIGQVLANVGRSSLNYGNKMRELARQRMIDRQNREQQWDEAQRGVRVKGFDVGTSEGKEVLQGQRTGITGLGDIIQADASTANAILRSSGSGAGNKALEDASQAVARDRQIQEMTKYIRDNSLEPGSAEYNKYTKMIEDRERAIYAAFKAPYPEYPQAATPAAEPPKKEGGFWSGLGSLVSGIGQGAQKLQSGQAQKDIPIQPAKTKSQMVVGQMYNTAKGPARWNGTDYEQ